MDIESTLEKALEEIKATTSINALFTATKYHAGICTGASGKEGFNFMLHFDKRNAAFDAKLSELYATNPVKSCVESEIAKCLTDEDAYAVLQKYITLYKPLANI